ncbi:MAG: hypothetical protein ACK5OC_21895 [Pirellula sp.]
MKILDLSTFDNHFSDALSAEQLKNSLVESGAHLRDLVVSSANDGNSFGQVERTVFQALKKIGFGAMALLIKLQGDGDMGHKIASADRSLSKNPNPSVTRIRSIFGEHSFQECTYENTQMCQEPFVDFWQQFCNFLVSFWLFSDEQGLRGAEMQKRISTNPIEILER